MQAFERDKDNRFHSAKLDHANFQANQHFASCAIDKTLADIKYADD